MGLLRCPHSCRTPHSPRLRARRPPRAAAALVLLDAGRGSATRPAHCGQAPHSAARASDTNICRERWVPLCAILEGRKILVWALGMTGSIPLSVPPAKSSKWDAIVQNMAIMWHREGYTQSPISAFHNRCARSSTELETSSMMEHAAHIQQQPYKKVLSSKEYKHSINRRQTPLRVQYIGCLFLLWDLLSCISTGTPAAGPISARSHLL